VNLTGNTQASVVKLLFCTANPQVHAFQNGARAAPFVPGFVADAAGVQKVLSALYLFLFGLGLRSRRRNMCAATIL
jgi:hypothetical protein